MKTWKKWAMVPISSSMLLACGAQSIEGQLTAINEQSNEMTATLNEIQLAEAELQAVFEADLQADGSLASVAKKNSQTQKNLNDRQDALTNLKEATATYNERLVSLEEMAAETTSSDKEQTQLATAAEAISQGQVIAENLQLYVENYQISLDAEANYYEALPAEKTDYTAFKNGMREVNAAHQTAQSNLAELQEPLHAIQALITDALNADETAHAGKTQSPALVGILTTNLTQKSEVLANGE